ncbi:MAG: hypothetical protein CMJ83_16825 [Planctomycetes bacterium]|nr:hypothetical protein [Planctomycetota bacterium]
MRHCCSLSLLALIAVAIPAQDLIWPGFRGPARNGVAAAANPPVKWSDEKNVRWKAELPGPGSASPIIVGDRVYVACYSGYGIQIDDHGDKKDLKHHLVCIDRKTGKVVWDRAIPSPLEKDARRVQITEHGFASPTPICDGRAIYAYFGHAGIVAVGLDGNVLWKTGVGTPSKDAPPPTNTVVRKGQTLSLRWGAGASPVLHENLVIVNASEESNSVRAYDKKTGKLVWHKESSNLEGSATSPVVVGSGDTSVLVIVLAGEIWGLAPKTGKPLWSVETKSRGGMCPTPVADGSRVYAFGGGDDSYAINFDPTSDDAEKTRIAWKSAKLDICSPTLHADRLYLVSTQGFGSVLDTKTGDILVPRARLDGRTGSIYASPTLANGRLYIATRKRGVYVYSARDFKLLSRNELTDDTRFDASPAVAGKELYLRSEKYLYCIASS